MRAAAQAQIDLTTAYNAAAGQAVTATLTDKDLGGMTLTPGVYFFKTSAQLTGALTLNDLGNPNALFVFQIGTSLTTGSNSSVVFTNSLIDKNVFWQFGTSATLRDPRYEHRVRGNYSRAHQHHPRYHRKHHLRCSPGANCCSDAG
jgi:hypothetical protein